jgi:hypothetical protein
MPFTIPVEKEQASTAAGLVKAAVTGVRGGIEGAAGFLGDIPEMAGQGTSYVLGKVGATPEQASKTGEAVKSSVSMPFRPILLAKALQMAGIISPETAQQLSGTGAPTSAQVGQATDAAVNALPSSVSEPLQDVSRHQAQGPAERGLETAGNFAGGALLPGGPLARAARVLLPAAATEAAGEATKSVAPDWEPAARMVAGFIAGGGVGTAENAFRLRSALRAVNATPAAARRVRTMLIDQGMSPDDAAARMRELGPQATTADTGPNTRQAAQKIQAGGGAGRGIIDPLLRQRETEANPRLEADVTTAVGPQQQRSAIEQGLKDRLSEATKAQEQSHAAQTAPIDVQGIVDDIDTRLGVEKSGPVHSALQKVRDSLFIKKTAPDQPDQLEVGSEPVLSARQAIREMLYDQNGAPRTDIGPKQAAVLKDIYAKVNTAIDPANKTLRGADKTIEQIGKEKTAFTTGQETFDTQRGTPSPVEFQDKWNAMSDGEQGHVLSGVNVETWRQLGITGNDRVKLQQILRGEGKWNFEKLATVVGSDKAQALMNALEREKVFNETYNKVVQGSKTAETVDPKSGSFLGAAAGAVPDVMLSGAMGGPAGGMAAAGVHARRYLAELMSRHNPAADVDVARMLMSQNPDDLVNAMQILGRRRSALPSAVTGGLLARQPGQ